MIEKEEIELLKEIFVEKDDCHAQAKEIEESVNKNRNKLTAIKTDVKSIKWLIGAGVSAFIAVCVKIMMGV